ncbi:hypothetical protein AAF712_009069 [Marasmius tenuissimus]|uniref:Major facilitator superfamily (MFS) profile domain-containing protein n=1 Tax=Marasmius tenuissimus TaxID=585030 RepID=A0ABR2ZQZ6_9AGAR
MSLGYHREGADEDSPLLSPRCEDEEPLSQAGGPLTVVLQSTEGTVVQSQGVTRMEAIGRAARTSRTTLYAISISVFVCAWVYSLDQSTTQSYTPLVTSYFKQHSSGLATLSITKGIISSVCKPFIAKISDITSRPYTYVLVLVLYVIGYIAVAFSRSITTFIVGEVFVAIGASGLQLLNTIITADLTPLQWRGFVGSILAAPWIVNVWLSGSIVQALSEGEKWRWGYGMFAIIMPVCLSPAILTLIYLDGKARQEGVVNLASSGAARRTAEAGRKDSRSWWETLADNLEEIDAIGLAILGVGWTSLLLPFSLKNHAENGWGNPYILGMLVIGIVLVVGYIPYEMYVARMPSAPRRLIMNQTFIMSVIIDFFYLLCGQLTSLFWSSYVFIAKPWSVQNWTYYNNIITLALCIFGLVAGLYHRWTHRYKLLQIVGLAIKIIGIAILIDPFTSKATNSTTAMILSPILIGMGGSFSVVGSTVAAQASVPHQDTALVISLLGLWTAIGSSIGSAVSAALWGATMPGLLKEYLPPGTSAEEIRKVYEDVTSIREYGMDHPVRVGAVEAYRRTQYYLFVPALGMALIPLVAAMFQQNYYLGEQHNVVTNTTPDGRRLDDDGDEEEDGEGVQPLLKGDRKSTNLRRW